MARQSVNLLAQPLLDCEPCLVQLEAAERSSSKQLRGWYEGGVGLTYHSMRAAPILRCPDIYIEPCGWERPRERLGRQSEGTEAKGVGCVGTWALTIVPAHALMHTPRPHLYTPPVHTPRPHIHPARTCTPRPYIHPAHTHISPVHTPRPHIHPAHTYRPARTYIVPAPVHPARRALRHRSQVGECGSHRGTQCQGEGGVCKCGGFSSEAVGREPVTEIRHIYTGKCFVLSHCAAINPFTPAERGPYSGGLWGERTRRTSAVTD